jgi:DNA invertase Pin-like site-specific DNA recombinase
VKKSRRATTPTANAASAVAYLRVSSKEQEKEGFSIDAQRQLVQDYAARKEMALLRIFEEAETAKRAGRTVFGEMLHFFRKNPSCCTLVVEKTDRLYRNFADLVKVDDLNLDIHFVKEGVVLTPDSKSSDKLAHNVKVVLARHRIDNLSEETKKGMLEKARQGYWPSFAPLGYLNVDGARGKRTIKPDPLLAPVISRIFEIYASGHYSLKQVAKMTRADGLCYRKSGDGVPTSTIQKILRNRIYSGDFDFDGVTYTGTYEPITPRTCGIACGIFSMAAGRKRPAV